MLFHLNFLFYYKENSVYLNILNNYTKVCPLKNTDTHAPKIHLYDVYLF